ncbi:rhomboid family intramembrane serine protease [Legionella dresdenensis]|uniref:Rhomboid family intramembrane serine protease n=1 Tax=Legionella dresdenensis TaxID=450200 RepID=A0ABV8CBR7_9GAMM
MITLDELNSSMVEIIHHTRENYPVLAGILIVLWGAFFLEALSGYRLLYLGIRPRHLSGLPGIVFAPLLHANFNHLFFNTIPLIVLSNFLLIDGLNYFLAVTAVITLISGVLIWCFAKPGVHVGASAVITGYWGLLVTDVYNQGTLTALILGAICIYYFAGIFLGIFPRAKGVSWEGHLFGLAAGIAASFIVTGNSLPF